MCGTVRVNLRCRPVRVFVLNPRRAKSVLHARLRHLDVELLRRLIHVVDVAHRMQLGKTLQDGVSQGILLLVLVLRLVLVLVLVLVLLLLFFWLRPNQNGPSPLHNDERRYTACHTWHTHGKYGSDCEGPVPSQLLLPDLLLTLPPLLVCIQSTVTHVQESPPQTHPHMRCVVPRPHSHHKIHPPRNRLDPTVVHWVPKTLLYSSTEPPPRPPSRPTPTCNIRRLNHTPTSRPTRGPPPDPPKTHLLAA